MEKAKDMDQEMSSLIESVYGGEEKPAPSDDKAESARWSVSGSVNFQSFQTDSAVEAMEGFKSDIKGKVVDNRSGEVAAEVNQEGDKATPAWQAGQDLQTAYDKEKDAYEMGRIGDEITPDIENDKEKLTAYAHGAQASYSEAVDYLSRAQNDPEFKSVMEQRDWDHAELESNAASAQEAVDEAQQRLDAMEREKAENEESSVSLDKNAIQQAQTEADVAAATESTNRKEEARQANPVPAAESDDGKRSKIPPELEGKYRENGNRLLDRQGKARFEVTDDNIKSLEKDPRDAADMVAVADHNGWEAIKLKGDKEFRREAWIEAESRGIETKGYSPSEEDKDRAAARKTELQKQRQINNESSPTNDPQKEQTDINDNNPALTKSKENTKPEIQQGNNDPAKENTGFKEEQSKSYSKGYDRKELTEDIVSDEKKLDDYIKGATERHEKDSRNLDAAVWDHKRDSLDPDKGTLKVILKEDDKIASEEKLQEAIKARESLNIEKEKRAEKLESKTSAINTSSEKENNSRMPDESRKSLQKDTPSEIGKKHPELEKAATVVAAAEVFAKEKIANDKDREQFSNSIREMLIDRLDKGEPIKAVELREFKQPKSVAANQAAKEMADER